VPWSTSDTLRGLVLGLSVLVVLNVLLLAGGLHLNGRSLGPVLAAAVLLAVVTAIDAWTIAWAWAFSLRKYRLGLAAWGFVRPLPATLWLLPVAFALSLVVQFVHHAVVDPPPSPSPSWLLDTHVGITVLFISTCVLAPLVEEAFFRGFVFYGLAGSTGWLWAAIISSAAFAACHVQLYSLVPLFAQGLILCWVRRSGGSIWGAVALHFTNNFIVLALDLALR
jgi:membrane protease YdiL (CAAX protease family)